MKSNEQSFQRIIRKQILGATPILCVIWILFSALSVSAVTAFTVFLLKTRFSKEELPVTIVLSLFWIFLCLCIILYTYIVLYRYHACQTKLRQYLSQFNSSDDIAGYIQTFQDQLAEYQKILDDIKREKQLAEDELQHKLQGFDNKIATLQETYNPDQLQADLELCQKILKSLEQSHY